MSAQEEVIRVRDIMKQRFDRVDGMSTIQEALQAMENLEAKCLIVNKSHADDVYGILLLSDIAREVLAANRPADRVNVYEVMTKPVISVEADMNIRYSARLFTRFGLSRAPVVENGEIIGIISLNDMVMHGLRERA